MPPNFRLCTWNVSDASLCQPTPRCISPPVLLRLVPSPATVLGEPAVAFSSLSGMRTQPSMHLGHHSRCARAAHVVASLRDPVGEIPFFHCGPRLHLSLCGLDHKCVGARRTCVQTRARASSVAQQCAHEHIRMLFSVPEALFVAVSAEGGADGSMEKILGNVGLGKFGKVLSRSPLPKSVLFRSTHDCMPCGTFVHLVSGSPESLWDCCMNTAAHPHLRTGHRLVLRYVDYFGRQSLAASGNARRGRLEAFPERGRA